ncbi:MAG TPA: tetratricopeptide repeat protein, partial [Gammaproteobacteria bacterium]|nr:tetratricopeptide repeat protein [Gammaproteobacteria bacterium]
MNDRSEKEQLEELRAWWAENGRFVIAGVLLGVAAIFGWNQWQARIEKTQIEASNLFEDVMEAVGSGNTEAAEAAANELYANYQRTVYPD